MDKLQQYTLEILQLKKTVGSSCWQIGNKLNEIKESRLYLLSYGTWGEYLEKAADISPRSAQNFMQLASSMEKDIVEKWGATKATLLVQVSEPLRKEIMEIHNPGNSIKEIKRSIHQLKSEQTSKFNEELAYFLKTENLIVEATEKAKETVDHFKGCFFKKSFEAYPRKKNIIELIKQLKKEVNYGNQI